MTKSCIILIGLIITTIGLSLQSCYYDNFEDLNPKDTSKLVSTCDTFSLTYTKHIAPILQNNCMPCHNSATKNGGLVLDNYESTKASAATGKLYSSIIWDGKVSQMPKGSANKINDCAIAQVKKWIATGYTQ